MSGLLAIVPPSGRRVDATVMTALTSGLTYRGDADPLTIQRDGVALGYLAHRLTEQCSPRPFDANQVVVMLSGWILNQEELARRLGVDLSDSQALLAEAYRRWGERFVQFLIGEFALIVWDAVNRKLVAATDHFGTRPMFWSQAGDGAHLVANCLNTLTRYPAVSTEWDEASVRDVLVFSYRQDLTSTEFRSVKRLPPAHSLILHEGQARLNRYWDPEKPEYVRRGAMQTVEEFREVFSSAMRPRLKAKGLTFELSGGIDSTSNLVTAVELGPSSPIQAVTSVFHHSAPEYEAPLARATATALGVAHQQIVLDEFEDETPLSDWMNPLLTECCGAPGARRYRRSARFGPVIVSGQGGDPALASYGWESGNESLVLGLTALLQHLRVWGLEPMGLGWKSRLFPVRPPSLEIAPWIQPKRCSALRLPELASRRVEVPRSPFWADLFWRKDSAVWGCPVHLTYPFFDLRVWRFLNTVAPVPWFRKKALARLALRGRVSERVVSRPKTSAPSYQQYYRLWVSHGPDLLERLLSDASPECQRFLHLDALTSWAPRLHTLPFGMQRQLISALHLLRWSGQEFPDQF